jgi:hypothetical protein
MASALATRRSSSRGGVCGLAPVVTIRRVLKTAARIDMLISADHQYTQYMTGKPLSSGQ